MHKELQKFWLQVNPILPDADVYASDSEMHNHATNNQDWQSCKVIATSQSYTDLGASTKRNVHTPKSAMKMQQSLNPGTNSSDSSDALMISCLQRDTTFAQKLQNVETRDNWHIQVLTPTRESQRITNSGLQAVATEEEDIARRMQCKVQSLKEEKEQETMCMIKSRGLAQDGNAVGYISVAQGSKIDWNRRYTTARLTESVQILINKYTLADASWHEARKCCYMNANWREILNKLHAEQMGEVRAITTPHGQEEIASFRPWSQLRNETSRYVCKLWAAKTLQT